MTSTDRRLLLVRHSKAEHVTGIDDHDRHLTARGWRDAEALGGWLAAEALACGLVICSTSVRTRETWEGAVRGGASSECLEFRRTVYHGGTAATLDTIRDDGADFETVMVVGHAPTMPVLTRLLSDGHGSPQAQAAAANGFPTSAVALLRHAGPWADLGPATATLERFHVARG